MNRFVLVFTAILAGAYAYLAWRLAQGMAARLALAVPFVLIWLVPVIYYSGAGPWLEHFRALGFRVLLNAHETLSVRGARVVVGGVIDPAGGVPEPELAAASGKPAAFRLLLAHNPKLAPRAQAAGFD